MMRTLVAFLTLSPLAPAYACPFCGTETSQEIRANIFNESFWANAALIASPFPLLFLTVAALHLGFSARRAED